jgi:hypothetical protein
MLNLFNSIKKLSRLWVIITLILQNQLTFYAPSYLCDCLLLFERNENAYNLRNQTDYSNPFTRLQLYRNSFFPSSIKLWNNLTPEMIITLILQNQLTFYTGFWGSRTWKLDNIKLVQEEFMHLRIYATVYYSLSKTKMLTICIIKQIIVTHLLGYNCIATHFFLDSKLEHLGNPVIILAASCWICSILLKN